MDKKTLVILACLRQDSRQKLKSLSKKTKVPVSTIFDMLSSGFDGLVKKHTTLVDFGKLGFNARATIVVKAKREEREQLQEFLVKNSNVNSLVKINNGFDFLVEVIFRHLKDTEDFIEDLENKFSIEEKKIFYTIDDLKKEGFLSEQNSIGLIKI